MIHIIENINLSQVEAANIEMLIPVCETFTKIIQISNSEYIKTNLKSIEEIFTTMSKFIVTFSSDSISDNASQ